MATTNLISQSLGDVLVETGNGTPTHTSPKGSLYTDQDTGWQYLNLDGSTTWTELIVSAFGETYRTATSTVSPSTTGWTELTTNFSLRNSSGISQTSGRLVVDTGYAGTFGILATMTVRYVATNSSESLGISVNQANPVAGRTQTTSISNTRNTGNMAVYTTASLADGDTVSTVIQAGTSGNVDIDYQNILIWRKGD